MSRRPGSAPVVLIVIDGLTPSMLEATDAPALRFLLEHGSYRRAVSTFPSLTPVCLASIATGGHPDVHGIPHLVWWNRDEQRLVEYGSSFAALRASGLVQGVRDTVVNLNERHLLRSAETVFEALEDAGLTTAAINITTYRGRNRHLSPIPGFPPVHGPKRFFFYSVYESDRTGAPIAWLNRSLGSIDAYAAAIGRWLVTRDGFDLLVHYLPDYDYASHALGPDAAHEALGRADASIAALLRCRRRAGRVPRALRRRRSAPTTARRPSRTGRSARGPGRARRPPRTAPRCSTATIRARLATALDGEPSVDLALFLEDGEVVARRDGDEDPALLDDYPDGRARAEGALRNPNAGEVLVSAAPGWEFVDLAGRQPRRRRQPRRAGAERLRGADAHRRARRAAGVDHRDQGPAARPLRRGGRRSGLIGVVPAPTWIDRQLRSRGIRDERVLDGDGARPARAVRARGAPRRRLRRRPGAARLTARRSPSPTWSRSRARRSRSPATSACSTSAPAPGMRPPSSPSWPRACTRSSGSPRSPTRRASRSRRPATSGSRSTSATARSGSRSWRRSTRSPSPPPRRRLPAALWQQLREGGRIVAPACGRAGAGSASVVLERSPDGPKRRAASVPARFVPLVPGNRTLTNAPGCPC